MKRAVDLTESRLFSKPIGIPRIFVGQPSDIPWRHDQYHKQLDGPILTGSKHDRECARISRIDIMAMEGEEIPFCYRCGKEMKIPWKRFEELCDVCAKELEKSEAETSSTNRRIPWHYEREYLMATDDRVVLEMNYQRNMERERESIQQIVEQTEMTPIDDDILH